MILLPWYLNLYVLEKEQSTMFKYRNNQKQYYRNRNTSAMVLQMAATDINDKRT